jgi:hypothetical protein
VVVDSANDLDAIGLSLRDPVEGLAAEGCAT